MKDKKKKKGGRQDKRREEKTELKMKRGKDGVHETLPVSAALNFI